MSEGSSRTLLTVGFAARSLWRRRRQFALLLLTLVAAFWAAFGILGAISGSERQLREDLGRVGLDVINVHPPLDPFLFLKHGLTVETCERLARLVGGIAAPANLQPGLVRAAAGTGGAEGEPVLLLGTTSAWSEANHLEILAGRFFRADEASSCAIDEWAFRRLFPGRKAGALGGDDSIELKIAGRWETFRVVGIIADPFHIRERFEDWDTTGISRSYIVRFMEYKNVYLPRARIARGDEILAAAIRVGEGVDPGEAALRISRDLEDRGSSALAWSRKEWAGGILAAIGAFSAASHFVWIAVLLVSASMVVTVVFIIVRGRFPEIAIRRVEGAGKGEIAAQLILENLLLAVISAALGLGLAEVSGAWIERSFLGWPVGASPGDVLLVVSVGTAIIFLTTALPARRAAALDPVRVLRER